MLPAPLPSMMTAASVCSAGDARKRAAAAWELDAVEEQGRAEFGGVVGAVAFGVVKGGEIDFASAHGGGRERGVGIAAVLYADHAAGHAVAEHVDGNVRESDGDELVDGIRLAAAQVVGQVADHDFVPGAAANFFAQGLADVRLFTMTVGIGFAVFLHGAFLPDGAFGNDDESVVAGVVALVFGKKFGDAVDVERIFGNEAARGGDVGGVQRGEAGIAAEDAEDADAFVRAKSGALAGDEFFRARDGGGEANAVFRALHIVVHRFGNGDDGHARSGESGGEAEGIVAADGDEAGDAEAVEIFEDHGSEVVIFAVEGKFFDALRGDTLGKLGFGHFARVGTRGVQDGAAGAVDGAGIFTIERADVGIGFVGGVHVRKTLPALANSDDGSPQFASTINHRFDHGVQARDVASSGEDRDFVFCWHWDESPSRARAPATRRIVVAVHFRISLAAVNAFQYKKQIGRI